MKAILRRKIINFPLIQEIDRSRQREVSLASGKKNYPLTKSISEAAWRMLVTTTSYKAASADSVVVPVDPRKTSQLLFQVRP